MLNTFILYNNTKINEKLYDLKKGKRGRHMQGFGGKKGKGNDMILLSSQYTCVYI